MPARQRKGSRLESVPASTSSRGAGWILRLIREGRAASRPELVRITGLARATVAQRVDTLLAHRLVSLTSGSQSTGGRPATRLAFNGAAGVTLAAELHAQGLRAAATDLAGTWLAELAEECNPSVIVIGGELAAAPEQLLAGIQEMVFRHAVPLVTRDLVIAPARIAHAPATVGAALMAVEHVLAPEILDRALECA